MAKTRVAIACQGGGSQTAFTAGALKALCETDIGDEVDIVSISGTSGGAVCAALVWYAFAKVSAPFGGALSTSGKTMPPKTGQSKALTG